MTGPLSREAQQAGSLLHPLGCLCSISQGNLGTCKRLTKQSEELLHWERDENLGRQSLTHLPAPGEQRSLSKGKASSSSTNCCTNLTIGTHQCQVTISSAAKCVTATLQKTGNSSIPLEALSATSPTPPGDTDPPSVLLSLLAGNCPAMPAFLPDELSVINRPRQGEPICLGSLAAQHLGLQAPPSTFSL